MQILIAIQCSREAFFGVCRGFWWQKRKIYLPKANIEKGSQLTKRQKNQTLGHASSYFASGDSEMRVTKWISVTTITCPYSFIVRQRHILRAVPVSEICYEWKETSGRYWVCGHDHQVYAPDYPQKCCCGCSILWRWRDMRDVRDILHLSCHLA